MDVPLGYFRWFYWPSNLVTILEIFPEASQAGMQSRLSPSLALSSRCHSSRSTKDDKSLELAAHALRVSLREVHGTDISEAFHSLARAAIYCHLRGELI